MFRLFRLESDISIAFYTMNITCYKRAYTLSENSLSNDLYTTIFFPD